VKPIPGYEGLYWATEDGHIVSRGRQLREFSRNRRYAAVSLSKNNTKRKFSVHRLVATAWHGVPSVRRDVNHINGDTLDNRPANLEWVTHAENQSAERALFLRRGDASHYAKLSASQVEEIRALCAAGAKQADVAPLFGITYQQVSKIVRRVNWAHL
jgi:hypothetical protein